MSSFDAMRELSDEVVRLRSDLKAKDAENADLTARLERAEKALEQAVKLGRIVIGDNDRICADGFEPFLDHPELAAWLKERR